MEPFLEWALGEACDVPPSAECDFDDDSFWDPLDSRDEMPEPDVGPMADPEPADAPVLPALGVPDARPPGLPSLHPPGLTPARDLPHAPRVTTPEPVTPDPEAPAASSVGPAPGAVGVPEPGAASSQRTTPSRSLGDGVRGRVDLRWQQPSGAAGPLDGVAPRDGEEAATARAAQAITTRTARSVSWAASPYVSVESWTVLTAVLALAGLLGLAPAVALYRRLKRNQLLDNPVRRRIYEHVCANPGSTTAEAARSASVHYVTAQRHLRTLHEFGHVVAHTARGGPRYFRNHGRYGADVQERLLLLRDPRNRHLLQAAAAWSDVGVSELARRLGLAKSTVSRRLTRLKEAGLVQERGRECVVAEGVGQVPSARRR